MSSAVVHILRKRSRRRHSWVFSNEVRHAEGAPQPGDCVRVYERGRFVGTGLYNPNSLIQVRLYSAEDRELDAALMVERITRARQLRERSLPTEEDFRLVYGESDGLPGLVIDRYRGHYVLQTYALGMDLRQQQICRALTDCFPVAAIVERNDFRLREAEGLQRREGVLQGGPAARVQIEESGVRFEADILHGQKTGHYFDQRVTRRKVRRIAEGRSVLDVFCYTGGFAVNAALGGATRVEAVDSSDAACRLAVRNAELNGVEQRCRFVVAEAAEHLKRLDRDGTRFDLVCLDPPSYIRSRREREAGRRAFRRVNALAMRLLSPTGILVTSSCSHHLSWQDMFDVLCAAAQDAGRDFMLLDRSTQGPDHPVLLSMPESEYLRSVFLGVI